MATKATLNTKGTKIEGRMLDITDLTTKAVLNTKTTKIEEKILGTTSFSQFLNLLL